MVSLRSPSPQSNLSVRDKVRSQKLILSTIYNMIKLIIFFSILLLIWWLAIKIKIVHVENFPADQQQELAKQAKLKTIVSTNYFKYDHPNADINMAVILARIKKTFADNAYYFNAIDKPVTQLYGTQLTQSKYLRYIQQDISKWPDFHLQKIIPLVIKETDSEFVARVIVQLIYAHRTLHLQLMYYGQITRSDEMTDMSVTYVLQLVDLEPISKKTYAELSNEVTNQPKLFDMAEQMAYVDRVNQMHKQEADSYR